MGKHCEYHVRLRKEREKDASSLTRRPQRRTGHTLRVSGVCRGLAVSKSASVGRSSSTSPDNRHNLVEPGPCFKAPIWTKSAHIWQQRSHSREGWGPTRGSSKDWGLWAVNPAGAPHPGRRKHGPEVQRVALNLAAELGFGRASVPQALLDAAKPNVGIERCRRQPCSSECEPCETGSGRFLGSPPSGLRDCAPPALMDA